MENDLERRIRERAYEIWEEEGMPGGREAQHWQQAQAEFTEARAEQGAVPPKRPSRRGKAPRQATAGGKKADGKITAGPAAARQRSRKPASAKMEPAPERG